ncbi:hypothetical protein BH09PSE5_BH09PSE5_09700 [soil metagenome]
MVWPSMQTLPWLIALALAALVVPALIVWALRTRSGGMQPLPGEWALAPRPVFSSDERRVYRQRREALPHHMILAKLSVVRFCQPTDPQEVRYWYELLGSIHVTFAICSANGRVLAAIDLDTDRGSSRRSMQIKQSVLNACRVRYLRCPVDHMPSIPELQLLVPQSGSAARGPQPAPSPSSRSSSSRSRDAVPGNAPRRSDRPALWQDSSFFQDSFFGPDSRNDDFGTSQFSPTSAPAPLTPSPAPSSSYYPTRVPPAPGARNEPRDPLSEGSPDDIAGIVVDSPKYSTRH